MNLTVEAWRVSSAIVCEKYTVPLDRLPLPYIIPYTFSPLFLIFNHGAVVLLDVDRTCPATDAIPAAADPCVLCVSLALAPPASSGVRSPVWMHHTRCYIRYLQTRVCVCNYNKLQEDSTAR